MKLKVTLKQKKKKENIMSAVKEIDKEYKSISINVYENLRKELLHTKICCYL